MTEKHFHGLFGLYPEVIAQMPDAFSSHEFILKLARQHQGPYIEALNSYIHSPNDQHSTPFKIVHGILANHLHAYKHLIHYVHHEPSRDIFARRSRCAKWRKV